MTEGDIDTPLEGETTDEAAADAPVLNREQRRAQARGKKSGTSGTAGNPFTQGGGGGAKGSGGFAGQNRLPRTGHK